MVFQSFNLFPHLTVMENCTLAPTWVKKMPKAEADAIAEKYLLYPSGSVCTLSR